MTEQEWKERYRILSVKGRFWKRSEIKTRAVKLVRLLRDDLPRDVIGSTIQKVLDEESFMCPRSGEVPARVIEAVAFEAFSRLSRDLDNR